VVPGIAWQAHLGGFVVGLAMAYAYAHIPRARAKLLAWVLPIGIFLVLLLATVLRYEAVGWLEVIRNFAAAL